MVSEKMMINENVNEEDDDDDEDDDGDGRCIRPSLRKILFPVDRVEKKNPSREGGKYIFFIYIFFYIYC